MFHEVSTGRWVKLTLPNLSGMELRAIVEMDGVRPTLHTADALPVDYLHRLRLANELLGDDFCFHGVLDDPAGPRLVVSQRHIIGEHAGTAAIARHFAHIGFQPINAKTFYDPEENLLVSDAHAGNVLRTADGLLVPFDVCLQRPGGALREAVAPAAALGFRRGSVGPTGSVGILGNSAPRDYPHGQVRGNSLVARSSRHVTCAPVFLPICFPLPRSIFDARWGKSSACSARSGSSSFQNKPCAGNTSASPPRECSHQFRRWLRREVGLRHPNLFP